MSRQLKEDNGQCERWSDAQRLRTLFLLMLLNVEQDAADNAVVLREVQTCFNEDDSGKTCNQDSFDKVKQLVGTLHQTRALDVCFMDLRSFATNSKICALCPDHASELASIANLLPDNMKEHSPEGFDQVEQLLKHLEHLSEAQRA
eukprot:TRINITY_DN50160_c0_g1_i1.p1 TRINITY_DN50160_c0_g1~~TRINITY_DN50160_c0_g1_i1.p1  ORF type:complete len:146 (-),score=17.47 TRINITY_DN50160_c0_g1_i1:51-488(-)